MLQYLITGLAGVALGIIAMRTWQARDRLFPKKVETPDEAPPLAGAKDLRLPSNRKLLLGAAVMVGIALATLLIWDRNDGDGASTPATGPNAQQLADVDTMIARLAARLEKNPQDGEGFRMLGWSYLMTGHPEKAIDPYKRALALLPNQANVHAGYGEALASSAGGQVTPDAKAAFDKALRLDPTEPRARYFAALWLAQNGQEARALDQWITLANSGPADASWQADVRRQIDMVSKKLGVDVSARLKAASVPAAAPGPIGALPPPDPAAVTAANALPENDRRAMIDQMVEGLATKLKANPANPDGWAKLLRSRMVLKQPDQAAKDLVAARRALAKDPAALAQVNAIAREIGVPGA